ncbi:hypothetical protein G7Y89_g11791 [Cudoniella acicularis]|uniref:Cytochrome P450 n=1 Tax=Cudoniella acicularis TaxID=354080 RepID=A0A8H4VXJ7_9HELO|nr:hypothetical protein G7Y89_g11791 [Cudoniella acicularis]
MILFESLGLLQCICIAVVLLVTYPLCRGIYNVTFHPLARFPGPRLWGASRIPFIRSFLTGNLVHDIEKLHQQYGPTIRIAPNEITFSHPDAWNDIFQLRPGHLPFEIDPVWWGTPPGQPESMASAASEMVHRRMRRVLGYGFTQRALRAQEPIIQKYASMLIDRLRDQIGVSSNSDDAVVDIVSWFNFFTFDLFGDLGFDESFECLQHSEYHPWISLIFNNIKATCFIITARFYPLIDSILVKCIPKSIKKLQSDHYQQVRDKVQRRLTREIQRPDLMDSVMKNNEKLESMSLQEIESTFAILAIAASETTATVLSGTFNHLLCHPEMLKTLVEEARSHFAKEEDMTLDALKPLAYLNAVLNEGLRVCPPVPIMLPRLVPKGGDTICGIRFPGGTSVSFQSRALFRNPEYFHKSTSFLPERYLPEARKPDSPFYNDKLDIVLPFGLGLRGCLGKDLAWAEMRLAIARLVWRFDVEFVGTPVKWEELKTFLLVEKKPVMIRIRERKDFTLLQSSEFRPQQWARSALPALKSSAPRPDPSLFRRRYALHRLPRTVLSTADVHPPSRFIGPSGCNRLPIKMWQLPIPIVVLVLSQLCTFFNSISATPLSAQQAMRFSPARLLSASVLVNLTSTAVCTNLYVSSYAGDITSLQLIKSADDTYSLTKIAANNGSSPSPTWLEKDSKTGIVYGLDEGFTSPNGSISSYKPSSSGVLTQIDRHLTLGGPVSSILYNEGKSLAVAHYGGSALSTWNILPTGGLSPGQNFLFTLTKPGANPARQEAPHPHEALVDPTDSFIVVPDLGADLIRVFSIDKATSDLTEQTPFPVAAGSGPRHGAFLESAALKACKKESYGCMATSAQANNGTFFFLISELANTVTSYKVTYGEKSLGFEQVFQSGTYGNQTTPVGAASAEAILSPDHKYLLTSSRNATILNIPNFNTTNSTTLPSDTLQSWSINPTTGKLTFEQLAPAGGAFPRQFSVNKKGDLAAVGLQQSARVVILERNVLDGTFGKFVAEIGVPGEVTSVVWDE